MIKQKLWSTLSVLCLILMGCTFQQDEKPDTMMLCTFQQKDEEGSKNAQALFTYQKATATVIHGSIEMKYDGFKKNEINNKILTDMTLRKSKLDDVEGVEMIVTKDTTSFTSKEEWNYKKIDPNTILYVDEVQGNLIDEHTHIYRIEKVREYYEQQGFQCSISDL